jgi:hypothetical protein
VNRSTAQAAARIVATTQLDYAVRGQSIAQAAMAGAHAGRAWQHFPARDVVDPAHGTRYFYHAHDSHRTAGEHGHFHLFAPDPGGAADGAFVHLAALSIDPRGTPLRWFMTNAWVTGESWRPAAQMRVALRGFTVETRGRLAPVARWLSAMVRLYEAELTDLFRLRDLRLKASGGATDDRRIDLLAGCPVNLFDRLSGFMPCSAGGQAASGTRTGAAGLGQFNQSGE